MFTNGVRLIVVHVFAHVWVWMVTGKHLRFIKRWKEILNTQKQMAYNFLISFFVLRHCIEYEILDWSMRKSSHVFNREHVLPKPIFPLHLLPSFIIGYPSIVCAYRKIPIKWILNQIIVGLQLNFSLLHLLHTEFQIEWFSLKNNQTSL